MTSQEIPSRDENGDIIVEENVEKYSNPEAIDTYVAKLRQKDTVKKETAAENELSLQKVSDAQSVENLTMEAVEAAKLTQNEQHFPTQEIGDIPSTLEDPHEEEERPTKHVSGLKKAALVATMFFSGLFGAKAAAGEKNPTDSIDFTKARPTKEIPAGYKEVKKDNKTYYYKIEASKKAPEKPRVKSSFPTTVKKSTSFHKPIAPKPERNSSVDIVYMEGEAPKEKEVNPFAAFAEKGEILFSPNKHAAAEMFYSIRDSKDIKDGGMLNTSKESALIRFRDDHGFTGEYTIVKSEDLPRILAGTRYFQSQKVLEDLRTNSSKTIETDGSTATR